METRIRLVVLRFVLSVVIFSFPLAHQAIADDIIDNGDPETSFTSAWAVSGASGAWNPADPGSVSLYSKNGATYTWTFTPTDSGDHDVSMWWTQWPSRATAIRI